MSREPCPCLSPGLTLSRISSSRTTAVSAFATKSPGSVRQTCLTIAGKPGFFRSESQSVRHHVHLFVSSLVMSSHSFCFDRCAVTNNGIFIPARLKGAFISQLSSLGRAVHPHSDPTVLAVAPGPGVSAPELQRALQLTGVYSCLYCVFGQKYPLVAYLSMLYRVRVPDSPIQLDLSVNLELEPNVAPLVALLRSGSKTQPSCPSTSLQVEPGAKEGHLVPDKGPLSGTDSESANDSASVPGIDSDIEIDSESPDHDSDVQVSSDCESDPDSMPAPPIHHGEFPSLSSRTIKPFRVGQYQGLHGFVGTLSQACVICQLELAHWQAHHQLFKLRTGYLRVDTLLSCIATEGTQYPIFRGTDAVAEIDGEGLGGAMLEVKVR
jgi:hypothetical protein